MEELEMNLFVLMLRSVPKISWRAKISCAECTDEITILAEFRFRCKKCHMPPKQTLKTYCAAFLSYVVPLLHTAPH